MLNSIDLNVRHGAVLATAEILEALYNHFNDKIENIIGKNLCNHMQIKFPFQISTIILIL